MYTTKTLVDMPPLSMPAYRRRPLLMLCQHESFNVCALIEWFVEYCVSLENKSVGNDLALFSKWYMFTQIVGFRKRCT